MSAGAVLGFISVFGAGLLAGEEFVIRYGVRGPLGRLDQEPHIRMRQGLIRTLRVLVPAILAPTLLSAVAVTVVDGAGGGLALRCAAILALPAWVALTLRRYGAGQRGGPGLGPGRASGELAGAGRSMGEPE